MTETSAKVALESNSRMVKNTSGHLQTQVKSYCVSEFNWGQTSYTAEVLGTDIHEKGVVPNKPFLFEPAWQNWPTLIEWCWMFVTIQKTRRRTPTGTCGDLLASLSQPWMWVLVLPVHQSLLDELPARQGLNLKLSSKLHPTARSPFPSELNPDDGADSDGGKKSLLSN